MDTEVFTCVQSSSDEIRPADTSTSTSRSPSKRGHVKQRNYKLNDVGALKKKAKHETRKNDITIGREAKDFSNITVLMRPCGLYPLVWSDLV